MKESEFKSVDQLCEIVKKKLSEAEEAGKLTEVIEAIREATAKLPESLSIEVDVRVSVFDREKERSIHLLSTGYSSFSGGDPYRSHGDSTVHRYIVDGEICQLPHDYCPSCWGEWGFKFDNPVCPECGVTLGERVKLLLDTDVCPYCEKGKVTMSNPVCSECSFEVDPSWAVWG